MGEIHHFHRRAFQILHIEGYAQQCRSGFHGDTGRGQIIRAEGNDVAIAAGNRDPLRLFVNFNPCLLERRIGKLAMQRMAVFRPGRAEAGQATMDHEGAIGFKIDLRVDRLIEHRLHRQVAAVETGAPDLLSLEGQNNDLAAGISDPHCGNAGCISEGRDGEFTNFNKPAFGMLETGRVEFDPHRHSFLRALQRIRSPLVSSKM